MTVFWDGSVLIFSRVWRVRILRPPGVSASIRAASATAAAEAFSPSAEMMAARRSRSASACFAMARFISAGSSMFCSLTFSISIPHLSV